MQQTPNKKIRELTARLNQWRYEYYTLNASTVTDAVYDRHFDELKRLENETGFAMSNSPTQTVGYAVVSGLEKTAHSIPLLSLEKTKQMDDVMRFISSHEVMLMHKLDGLTVKLEYENGSLIRASTRGNGEEGEVITHNAKAVEGIPAKIPHKQRLVVVGEGYITKPVFDKLKNILRDSTGNPYRNSRNMAAGSIRSYNAASCAERGLAFTPFSVLEGLDEDRKISTSKSLKLKVLERLGFSPCIFFLHEGNPAEKDIKSTISKLRSLAEKNGLPIDGIVITYNDIPFALSKGRTGHHNYSEFGIKVITPKI
jgi:DNA ligase (NAD+)